MGSHYTLEVIRKNTKPSQTDLALEWDRASCGLGNAINNEIIGDFISRHSYITSCREFLLGHITNHESSLFGGNNIITGIKCSGLVFLYSAEKLINTDHKTILDFISAVFGFNCTMEVRKKSGDLYKFYGGHVLKDEYDICLYFKSWENKIKIPLIKLSALLGILRESTIISKILAGEVNDSLSLIKALLNLADSRLNKKDNTFLHALFYSDSGTSWNEFLGGLAAHNAGTSNSTGSDFASITFLALFIMYLQESRLVDKCSFDGPVSFMKYYIDSGDGQLLLKFKLATKEYEILDRISKVTLQRNPNRGLYKKIRGAWRKSE